MTRQLPYAPFAALCAVCLSACQLTPPPKEPAVVQPFVFPEEMTVEDHRAALSKVKASIAAGEVDIDSTHAVRDAAGAGDVEYLRYLISRGANLKVDDAEIIYGNSCIAPEYDYSPLARAARHGHIEVARLLIQQGATLRGVVECIENDRLEMLELLRQGGANLHDGEFEGDGLFYPNTWRAESEEMLRYLITHGISRTLNPRCGGLVSSEPEHTAARISRLLRVGIWGPHELEVFLKENPGVSYPPSADK